MSTPVTELELPQLDTMDPALRGDAVDRVFGEVAKQGPVAQAPLGFVVLSHAAGEVLLRTKGATFPGMVLADLFGVTEGPLRVEMERNILHLDGDVHRRLRSKVGPSFTPRAADRWRPLIRETVEDLVAGLPGTEFDLVAELAQPFPARVIATVMGAPLADAPRLADWSQWIQRQFDADALTHERPRIEQACAEFYDWAYALLAQRKVAPPQDDLIGQLLTTDLDDDELVNLVLNVLIGGVDTTQSQLAQALRLFAEHPDQWALLHERPELLPQAVEEVVRFAPITPFTARITHEDVEAGGVTFPAGTVVMVCAHTANRDPAVFGDDAERFDITRERAGRVLTFGAGIHYCLGVNLARAELEEALGVLSRAWARDELAGEPRFGTITGIYGLDALPLRVSPRGRG